MDLPVGNGNVFGSKVVSWTSLLVTVTFLDQRWSVGPPVGNGNVFGSKVVSWTSLLVTVTFLDQRWSVGPPVGNRLVSMVFQGDFMVFHFFVGKRSRNAKKEFQRYKNANKQIL